MKRNLAFIALFVYVAVRCKREHDRLRAVNAHLSITNQSLGRLLDQQYAKSRG